MQYDLYSRRSLQQTALNNCAREFPQFTLFIERKLFTGAEH